MKKVYFSFFVFSIFSFFISAQVKNYAWGGSTTVAPIARAAIEDFQKRNPDLKMAYESIGSSAGINALLAGQYSLAGSSSELNKEQIGKGLVATAIALDGLSVVVNSSVSLSNLSYEQVAKIFHGDYTNWKEIGGPDLPIVLIIRDEASGSYLSFYEIFLKSYYKQITSAYSKNSIVTKENGEVVVKTVSTKGAIGYVGMAFADQLLKAGGKELKIEGVAPTVANVISKKYSGARSLYFVTIGQAKNDSVEKKFIDFVLSPRGQAIVKSTDFIPINKK